MSEYGPKGPRLVGQHGRYKYLVGAVLKSDRATRGAAQYLAEERLDDRTTVRRRFKSEALAMDQAERWLNFRKLQEAHPL